MVLVNLQLCPVWSCIAFMNRDAPLQRGRNRTASRRKRTIGPGEALRDLVEDHSGLIHGSRVEDASSSIGTRATHEISRSVPFSGDICTSFDNNLQDCTRHVKRARLSWTSSQRRPRRDERDVMSLAGHCQPTSHDCHSGPENPDERMTPQPYDRWKFSLSRPRTVGPRNIRPRPPSTSFTLTLRCTWCSSGPHLAQLVIHHSTGSLFGGDERNGFSHFPTDFHAFDQRVASSNITQAAQAQDIRLRIPHSLVQTWHHAQHAQTACSAEARSGTDAGE